MAHDSCGRSCAVLSHRRSFAAVGLAVAALLGVTLSARSQEAAGKKVALLVGVNKYEKRGFRDLEFAERDAQELKPLLEQAGYQVQLLTGSAEGGKRATLKNIQSAVGALLKERTKHDLVLIALAGHGLQLEVAGPDGKLQSESFFCPCDAVREEPATMLPMGKLFEDINRRGGGHNLVLVDACREDPTRGRGMDGGTVRTLPEGVAVLFGCRAGQKTYETKKAGGGHGVFFHFVLQGLRGEALNSRGQITWARLVEYVSERVSEDTPQLVGDASLQQTPNLIANLPGNSPLIATTSVLKPTGQRSTLFGLLALDLFKPDAEKLGMDQTQGALVFVAFHEASTASEGLQRGDVILTVDGERVGCADEFNHLIKPYSTGEVVKFEVWRSGRPRTIEVKLALQPVPSAYHRHVLGLAERGDAIAQYCLAEQFEFGQGVGKDQAAAFKWHRRAAESGFAKSMTAVGVAYYYGRGVKQDMAEAMNCFRKSAAAGNASGQFSLGYAYRYGDSNYRDDAKALDCFRKAAVNDHRGAQAELGAMYQYCKDVEQDFARAVAWYRRAAEAGHPDGQFLLGNAYRVGLVEKDFTQALRWMRKAAATGHAGAYNNLGYMYQEGQGVEQDYRQAVDWYKKSADKGSAAAECNVGYMYYKGLGVARDYQEAMKWFHKAALQGYAEAQRTMGMMIQKGEGVQVDYKVAMKWLRLAADQGDDIAANEIGAMYYHGQGVARDLAEAARWFRKAADAGNKTAQENLRSVNKN